jgi:hypothetical protein
MNSFVVSKNTPSTAVVTWLTWLQTLMITFAAFASAVPHAKRGHPHGHQLAHGLKHHAHAAPVAGRSISYDGSCGSWSGMTCAEGFCCGYVMNEVVHHDMKSSANAYSPVPTAGVVTLPSTAALAARLALVIAALEHHPRLTSILSPAWQ